MIFLLDTHVLIWWSGECKKISSTVKNLLMDERNTIFISFVSVWEIQIKSQLGKLELNLPLAKLIQDQQNINQFQLLPIFLNHIYFLENLPQHHKDPFDRLLISQSIIEQMPILSIDKLFDLYSIQRIW
ncbi:MAG: type II toxin-antitoxin system VapC family toxin [Pleurocapsa sp. MO_226.B13]|nr:type II toxin-antitoxin system VapC family toxin [Pleurocapsa sp. MO_226.B13]